MSLGEVSLKGIKRYLRARPDEMFDILSRNESYVFFRIVEEGPVGSLNVPVTSGRSIATDASMFPKGSARFYQSEKTSYRQRWQYRVVGTFFPVCP